MKKLKQTNDILLHLLDELPEAEAIALRIELRVLYSSLINQLAGIELTSMSYEAVAGQIRAKASVHRRKLVSRMKAEVPDMKNFALNGGE